MRTAIALPASVACAPLAEAGRVTQVVDIRKGVHCMIPKRVFVGHRAVARQHDRS